MATRFTRLSIVANGRQIDASLPATRPIGELLPQLAELFSLPVASAPAALALSLPTRGALPVEHTLAESGILDGEVLYLTTVEDVAERPVLDDVLSEVRLQTSSLQTLWAGKARDGAVTLLIGVVYLGACLSLLAYPSSKVSAAALVGIGLALAGLAFTRLRRISRAEVVGWCALLPAALAAFRWTDGQAPSVRVLTAVAAVALTCVVAAFLSGWHATAVFYVGGMLALVAGGAAALLAASASAGSITAWSAPVLVLALGLLPQVAISRSGLLSLAALAESGRSVRRDRLRASLTQTHLMVDAFLVVLAVCGAACAATLIWTGRPWQAALGGLLATIFFLRTRAFSAAKNVATLLVVPVTAVIATAATMPRWLGLDEATGPLLVTSELIFAGLIIAGLGYVRLEDVMAARLSRVWDFLDALAIVAVIPLLFLAQDVFSALSNHR